MPSRTIFGQRAAGEQEALYPFTKAITGQMATTGVITVWTPSSSTKKWRLKGGCVNGAVNVTLQATIAGGFFALYEETALTIVQIIAPVAKVGAVLGSGFPGPQGHTTLDGAAGVPIPYPGRPFEFEFPGPGVVAGTANKKLQLGYFDPTGALATIGTTGKIWWSGAVYGDEV